MKLSIIIPIYNDTNSLELLINEISNNTLKNISNIEFVLVDDGSHFETWLEVKKIREKYHYINIVAVRLACNQGQQRSTLCGFFFATGDIIITMDADYQHPPMLIPDLVECLVDDEHDLIYSVSNKGKPAYIVIFSFLIKQLLFVLFYDGKTDINAVKKASSFRCISADLILKVISNVQPSTCNIDTLLLFNTVSPFVINSMHNSSRSQKSSYNLRKRVSFVSNVFLEKKGFVLVMKVCTILMTMLFVILFFLDYLNAIVNVLYFGLLAVLFYLYLSYRSMSNLSFITNYVNEVLL